MLTHHMNDNRNLMKLTVRRGTVWSGRTLGHASLIYAGASYSSTSMPWSFSSSRTARTSPKARKRRLEPCKGAQAVLELSIFSSQVDSLSLPPLIVQSDMTLTIIFVKSVWHLPGKTSGFNIILGHIQACRRKRYAFLRLESSVLSTKRASLNWLVVLNYLSLLLSYLAISYHIIEDEVVTYHLIKNSK